MFHEDVELMYSHRTKEHLFPPNEVFGTFIMDIIYNIQYVSNI